MDMLKQKPHLTFFIIMNVTVTLILSSSFICSGYSSPNIRFMYVM